MNDNKECRTKKCSICKRVLPLERFAQKGRNWCRSCINVYNVNRNGSALAKADVVKIERIFKVPISARIFDTEQAGISLVKEDECFVELINYKDAWISNCGRVLEYKDGRYIIKCTRYNDSGEKVCTLQKNVYDGEKWIWKKQTIEVWRLVVSCFIVNFDFVGNTHCWHRNNDKTDNYYKNIYPVNDKQYNAVLEKFTEGVEITDEVITEIVNDILYKADDWYANKWKRTVFGVGYLGCSDSNGTRENDIYSKWANMMQRCYDKGTHKLKPYYAPCTVDIELHNFSNFRELYKENAMGDKKLDLDKDLLLQGNTTYSAETCSLIPHFTNTLFETRRGTNTCIVLKNSTGKYDVFMSILGKRVEVGTFDTEEEAKQGFVDYKQNYIREFAEKSKGKVPEKTYKAMMNWKVEITD